MVRLLVIAALTVPLGARADVTLRVLVAAAVEEAWIAGEGLRVDGVPTVSPALVRARDRSVRVTALTKIRLGEEVFAGSLRLVARGRGAMDVINDVAIEPYTLGTLAGEVLSAWPPEVLKAQAVAIRSYALHQKARREAESWDVDASVLSQRYAGHEAAKSVRLAADSTRGEYLAWSGKPILAAFHASAGGRTASAEEVWGEALPYLGTVVSPDDAAPDHFWSYEIPLGDLRTALRSNGHRPGRGRNVEVARRSPSGRVAALAVGASELSGRALRQILGGRAIRSALFDVRVEGERVRFLGSGAGHGVGLSQWGARELAVRGRTYREILSHYYPGTTLARVPSRVAIAPNRPTAWSNAR